MSVRCYWIIEGILVMASVLLHVSGVLSFDMTLHGSAWVVAGLVLLNGGWMAFDGGRALVVGDYVTVTGAFVLGVSSAWWAMVTLALLGLWYVPFGTLINSIVIVLLFLPPLRGLGGGG